MKLGKSSPPADAWTTAVELLAAWLAGRGRADALLESAAPAAALRAGAQHLFFGAVRHGGRLEAALGRLVAKPPRPRLRAALLVTGFELLEAAAAPAEDGRAAKVVHHAVERVKTLASPAEARLVNAVARKLAAELAASREPPADAPAEALAEYYSHPAWLVRRWREHFGAAATRQLLAWNQMPAPVYARWRAPGEPPAEQFAPTVWPGFYALKPAAWPEATRRLAAGEIYLQDPATRLATDLLEVRAGETVLDLCAAPGGKSLLLADTLAAGGAGGLVVAVDAPGPRLERLRENLARARGARTELLAADLRGLGAAQFAARGLPETFAAVLIDAPCSNTGVARHRVDVKWRLAPEDIARHARQQGGLLAAAARFVAPGGRLVYSTCSLEPEENAGVVAEFLRGAGREFTLEAQAVSRPWESRCDGAGAFRLRRAAAGSVGGD